MRAVTGLVVVLTTALLAVPAPPAAAAPAAPARVLTLITGDRIEVSGDSATRLPTPGRDDIPLLTRTIGGHLQVVPADVLDLLAADRLDPRLFDVTARPAGGPLPMIITYTGRPDAVRAAVGRVPVRDLGSVNALAVRVDAAAAAATWRRLAGTPYRKIWLDGTATPSIDVTVPLVGATAAWAAGFTGHGVGVGVLDTGIDATHPDLAQSVAGSVDFTGEGDVDRAGHGTHVASVIAGTGAASAGRFRGMAPQARLFSAKVCARAGCAESAILAGMQWAARDQQLRVVNLSFGRPGEPGDDLLELAVDQLTERYGTLFVAAAGNADGPVDSPASAASALAVGASTRDDTVAGFSDAGPRPGTGGLKPDLVAPGVDIVAARSGESRLPRAGGGPYTRLSGTSAAVPHVSGAAAILAEQHPQWTAARLKAALTGSATALAGTGVDRAGTGRLDVAAAVAAGVLAEPGGVFFDEPGRRTITYTNSGAVPVTLTLTPPAGTPLRLGAPAVTVPAAGSATVAVEADAAARPGRWTGVLTATAGTVTVRTAVGGGRPADRPTLTVRYLDRSGATARGTFGTILGPESAALPADGGSLSLPAGTYTVDAKIVDAAGVTLLSRPRLDLRRDTVLTLDARAAEPAIAPGASSVRVGFHVPAGGGSVQTQTGPVYAAQLGPGTTALRTDVSATWPDRSAAWSITGGHLTGRSAPPVADVRFTAGPPGYQRFTVAHGPAPITRFDLQVSYDGGRTWRRPMVIRVGDRGMAALRPGPASVRVTAVDATGSRIERFVTLTG